MTGDPITWANVLNSTGPLGLALIVLVGLLTASVALNGFLVRFILKDERIPVSVWTKECESHAKDTEAVNAVSEAVKELVWTVRTLVSKLGGV